MDFVLMLEASGTPESSALLHYFRPRIARDLGWSEAETTMEQCQARLRECRFLHARGPSTTSRWDNFHQGWKSLRPELSLLSLLLISYGVKMGFLGGKMSQTRNPGPSIEAPEEDQAGTMKGETRQKLWARCSNKLHCVCMALVNEGLRFDLDAWFFLSLPQSEALHTLRTELQSGPCGAFKAQMSESEGAALDICNRILEQMNSPDVWSFLGLWSGGQLLGGFARQMDLAHPEVRRQSALRKRMLDMMLALLQQKLLYASVPLFSYPQRLVLLASPCEATANAALVHLYRSYSAHQIACRTNSKWCKAYVRRSPFQLQVMKDVTAALQRANWTISKEVTGWVTKVFSGFGATWNEEAFGKARQKEETDNQAHEMADNDLWQTLSFSRVLPAAGLKEVEIREDVPDITWPASLFHIQRRQANERLRRITGPATWSSMTQQSLASAACELALLCDAVESNKVHLL